MNGPGRTITIVSTAILAYGSIVGLMLTGHSNLRAEIADLRTEMQSEHAAIRSEIQSDHAAIRSEMREAHANLRTEIANLRSEVIVALESIRADLRQIRDHLYDIGNTEQSEPAE